MSTNTGSQKPPDPLVGIISSLQEKIKNDESISPQIKTKEIVKKPFKVLMFDKIYTKKPDELSEATLKSNVQFAIERLAFILKKFETMSPERQKLQEPHKTLAIQLLIKQLNELNKKSNGKYDVDITNLSKQLPEQKEQQHHKPNR